MELVYNGESRRNSSLQRSDLTTSKVMMENKKFTTCNIIISVRRGCYNTVCECIHKRIAFNVYGETAGLHLNKEKPSLYNLDINY